jgi:hypothetical protein
MHPLSRRNGKIHEQIVVDKIPYGFVIAENFLRVWLETLRSITTSYEAPRNESDMSDEEPCLGGYG